jgi:galactoside O-acetyltransferase
MAFIPQHILDEMGFKFIGENVKVSDKCSIYNAANIEIGDNSRIDDFCILSAGPGGIKIGRYVHIACFCSLLGSERIELKDFSGLSSRVAVYSSSDDYSGNVMTNPCVPIEFTNVINGRVVLEKHVIIGVGSVILPNVTIGFGAAIGALSLVTKSIDELTIAIGVPAKFVKRRKEGFKEKEVALESALSIKTDVNVSNKVAE